MKTPIIISILLASLAIAVQAENVQTYSCESKVKEANELIQTVKSELISYRELKHTKMNWAKKRDAQAQALSIITDYRSKVSETSNDVVHACHVSSGANVYRRLETAYDLLNVEVALAQI